MILLSKMLLSISQGKYFEDDGVYLAESEVGPTQNLLQENATPTRESGSLMTLDRWL